MRSSQTDLVQYTMTMTVRDIIISACVKNQTSSSRLEILRLVVQRLDQMVYVYAVE